MRTHVRVWFLEDWLGLWLREYSRLCLCRDMPTTAGVLQVDVWIPENSAE